MNAYVHHPCAESGKENGNNPYRYKCDGYEYDGWINDIKRVCLKHMRLLALDLDTRATTLVP